MAGRLRAGVIATLTVLFAHAMPAAANPPTTFNPVVEAQNFSITQQRQTIYDTPQYQTQLAADSAASTAQALAAEAADPGRFFTDDLCWNLSNGCAGDIRLNDWATNGYGLVRPVLFTARDGATISGHVWATVAGPAKRPGIVITDGSVQSDENMYWYAAQTLAKAGYVVLTFDPQGQGQSDTFGRVARPGRGRPGPDRRPPVLRRDRGRDRLLPLDPAASVRARAQLQHPNQAFGASLRGPDMIDWYTTAWFDKYLKGSPGADAMLLTDRWRDDATEASVDPNGDGNAFSFYYYSRLDIHLAAGQAWDCEDLRDGCPGMVADDGYPGVYSYLAIDTSPDAVSGPGASLASGSSLTPCVAGKAVIFRLPRFHGRPITRVKVYVGKRLVMTRRGRSLRSVRLAGLPGTGAHRVRVFEYTRAGLARRVTRRVRGCG